MSGEAGLTDRSNGTAAEASTVNHLVSGWTFGACPLDTDAAEFGPFAHVVSIWNARRSDLRQLPARADFDVLDFRAWLGRVFIARIEHDPFTVRFALWGTVLTSWWGVDYSGSVLGPQSKDLEDWRDEFNYFKAMDRAPFIGVASGRLTQQDHGHIQLVALNLPCSDGDGLSHVISLHAKLEPKQQVTDILPSCPMQPVRR